MKFKTKEWLIALAVFVVLNLAAFPLLHNVMCVTGEPCPPITSFVPVNELMNQDSFYAKTALNVNWMFEIGYAIIGLGVAFASTKIKGKVK